MGGGNGYWIDRGHCLRGLSPRGRGKRAGIHPPADCPGSIPAWAGETAGYRSDDILRAVYPRVGGGNRWTVGYAPGNGGLSPRGRGKRRSFCALPRPGRSIPAWAGETEPGRPGLGEKGVYPRVGGGNLRMVLLAGIGPGLSPRGRGKRRGRSWRSALRGSIPAWAGETRPERSGTGGRRVYPRVGGGNSMAAARSSSERGLSPRGRGKRTNRRRSPVALRSIPAWAGETFFPCSARQGKEVYPRVGGGNGGGTALSGGTGGLSPRGRGKPADIPAAGRRRRSIPAWAGETPGNRSSGKPAAVYPRVGGGNRRRCSCGLYSFGLSPRGRGKRKTR